MKINWKIGNIWKREKLKAWEIIVFFVLVIVLGALWPWQPLDNEFYPTFLGTDWKKEIENGTDRPFEEVENNIGKALMGTSIDSLRKKQSNGGAWFTHSCHQTSDRTKGMCQSWTEHKLLLFEKGWTVNFMVRGDNQIEDVTVMRTYGILISGIFDSTDAKLRLYVSFGP